MGRTTLMAIALPTLLATACTSPPGKGDSGDSAVTDAPALTVDTPRVGAEFDAGQDVTVSGFVVDESDIATALAVGVGGDVSGELVTLTPEADGTWSTVVQLAVGDAAVRVTARDSSGASSQVDVAVTVYDPAVDRLPTQPTAAIVPEGPVTGDALSIAIVTPSTDPDGFSIEHLTTWAVDGAPWPGPDVAPGTVLRGQEWTATVVGFDGALSGPADVRSVTIGNASPEVDGVAVGPGGATVTDDLRCEPVNPRDRERDDFTTAYDWTVDGAWTGVTSNLLPAGSAVEGQDVVCFVTLDDGFGPVAFTSPTFQIGNSPPSPPTVTVLPEAPSDTDDLLCEVFGESLDPDGGPISYAFAWYRDGAYSGETGATLDASLTVRGEVWTCEIVATDDGGLTSRPGSASATILSAWRGEESAADAWATLTGDEASGAFGKTVALLGDIDGDALSEVFVGAKGLDAEAGGAYVFSGADISASGALVASDASASWRSPYAGSQAGGYRAVAAPGDLDGDGFADLLFGAPDADANGDASGVAWMFYGGAAWGIGADPDAEADWRVTGSANDHTGARLAAGDIDGDGFAEVLVAAPGSSDYGRTTGMVAVFSGGGARLSGSSVHADADWRIYGDAELDELGWTLKLVGDVDADGYEDFFVTALYADAGGSESGAGALVRGGRIPSSDQALAVAADARFLGDAEGDRMGYDALGGVDTNADGAPDLLVAEYQDDSGGVDAGQVHVFHGRPRFATSYDPADADHTVVGDEASARFGHVMANPGDLDNDGTEDVLIGALFASPTGLAYQGAAYVLLGPDVESAASSSAVDWRSYGEAASDLYGDALSSGRGDVDGDGAPDFAVGAQGDDSGGDGAGRVYIWRGRW